MWGSGTASCPKGHPSLSPLSPASLSYWTASLSPLRSCGHFSMILVLPPPMLERVSALLWGPLHIRGQALIYSAPR